MTRLLTDLVRGVPSYTGLLERVRRGEDRLVVSGGVGALPAAILAALAADLDRSVAVVVAGEKDAEQWLGDLAAAGLERVFHAPAPTLTPYQRIPASLKSRRDEFSLLTALAAGGPPIGAVLPARALFTRLPDPGRFSGLFLRIREGQELSLARTVERLVRLGYRRGDLVVETGDLAVRGGLFDVFPPDLDLAVRVELDGDTVASLRLFDPDTQRSRERIPEIALAPFAASEESEEARRLMTERIGRPPSEAERLVFAPAVSPMPSGWLDHAAAALTVVVEPASVEEEIAAFSERVESDRDPDRDAFAAEELVHPAERIRERLEAAGLRFDRLGAGAPAATTIRLPAEAIAGHDGRAAEAAADLVRALAAGEEVFVATRPTGGAEKLRRLAIEYGFHVSSERREGVVVSIAAEISAGFRLREPRLALYAEEEIFGEERRSASARRRPSEAFLSDLRDLRLGDAVVHADYGIGLFRGLKRFPVEGEDREFMQIEYLDQKMLLLPVERFDLVQKYSGVEDVAPVLDRLGSAGWGKRKASVRRAMRDMTDQLLKLYARRSTAAGLRLLQGLALAEGVRGRLRARRDGRPGAGDRRRQARHAVIEAHGPAALRRRGLRQDGSGHARGVQGRARRQAGRPPRADDDPRRPALPDVPAALRGVPGRRSSCSRASARGRSRRRSSRRLADGSVDIVIATHRMLGKDLAFRDLGLLVVDEEQRFGVAQKERLKEWKASIDVLAMSATPIPRSLHLSLSGLRDLSVIETPPRDRLAIETQVVPSKPEVIREAIEAELERGGQVFFVHNRVESIGRVKRDARGARCRRSASSWPTARCPRRSSRRPCVRFFTRSADVLLATTIVENGLDIPSANTILIDRADTFGLAQLYQLRGRVGRSDKPAYAYLLVEPTAALSDVARRRLASIQEFCDLGAGFRIAAKDLEIRGSGNILGGEQSGHIAAVGFETYLSLLEEAIREMRGEEALPERSLTMSLGLDLAIPHDYVADESWRMMIYKKVARASDDAALEEARREIADRFGEPPPVVGRLIAYARLRAAAERLGVTSLTRQAGRVHVRFAENAPVDPERLLAFVRQRPGASFSPARVLTLPAPEGDALLPALNDLLPLFARAAA